MQIRILGSAAGGGFPQWNCGCANCEGLRSGLIEAKARSQSQVAVSADGESWHLLNASPDLRQQLLENKSLQANSSAVRNSPIRSIHLTNADLDHTLGLLLLRESQPLKIYATKTVRDLLLNSNAYFKMLNQFEGQTEWQILEEDQRFELSGPKGENRSKIHSRIYPLEGHPPHWAKGLHLVSEREKMLPMVGLILESQRGKKLGYFPGVGEIDHNLTETLTGCDVILFDGTFWDNEELSRLNPGSRTARQMQHVPISGIDGSIEILSSLPKHIRKIYTHINNTNPILNERSPQARHVRDSGWEISFDGMEIEI